MAGTDGGAIAAVISSSTLELNVSVLVIDTAFKDTVAVGGNGGMLFWQAALGVSLSLGLRPGSGSFGTALLGGGGGLFIDRTTPSFAGSLAIGTTTVDIRNLDISAPVWAAFGDSMAQCGRCVSCVKGWA